MSQSSQFLSQTLLTKGFLKAYLNYSLFFCVSNTSEFRSCYREHVVIFKELNTVVQSVKGCHPISGIRIYPKSKRFLRNGAQCISLEIHH